MIKTATDNLTRIKLPAEIAHLYVHIPFCARICPYCAFYKTLADPTKTERFCEAILRELEQHEANLLLKPATIFFGGGTPTALSTAQLESLLRGFRERLDLSALREWTFEANPGSVSPRKATLLKNADVNRISLGVQSWNNEVLRTLGREHNAAQAEISFRILREAGHENVSIDLMFGLPGQTLEDWRTTLEKTIALQPEHISAYCLTYEEDTDFLARLTSGEFRQSDENDAGYFCAAMELLEAAGFAHYETSNYARPGFESLHNRGYWAGEDYLGLGPSAFSTIGLQRTQNIADYRRYSDLVHTGESPITSIENLTPEMKRTEKIALSLRTRDGIASETLAAWPNERDEFIMLGLLQETNGRCCLTTRGKLLADAVAEAFVS